MKPLETCPVCQTKMRWVLHDGANVYDCSNISCPIQFSEIIRFRNEENEFHFENGILVNINFAINNFQICINPESDMILIKSKNKSEKMPIVIKRFDINWQDLNMLRFKIETIVNFS